MKRLTLVLLLTTFHAWAQPRIVTAPVEHLYLPEGFDSNDTVEVVVTGMFPNTCYSRNDVKVKVSGEQIQIQVTAVSHEASLPISRCPDMVVPFKEVVHIGNLQGGDYTILVNANSPFALKDKLTIVEASSNSVDDHIYAATEWVERRGKTKAILLRWRYSNCIDIDKVQVISNKKDTLSILPVMKQLSDFCPIKMMPTEYEVDLPSQYDLVIKLEPLNPRINAEIKKNNYQLSINLLGGILGHEKMNDETLKLLLCHEVGHFLGGSPYKSRNGWSSTEGQADYYSTFNCVRKFSFTDESFIEAALALTSIYAEVTMSQPPRFETCEETRVNRTNYGYPSIQCRLDTLIAGWRRLPRPACWFYTQTE